MDRIETLTPETEKPAKWKDIVLFSHLIPLCQHYTVGFKDHFEQTVESRRRSFGDWDLFRDYLLTHPRNQGMLKGFIQLMRDQDSNSNEHIADVWAVRTLSRTDVRAPSPAQLALDDVAMTRERAAASELKRLDSVITWENVLCLMRNVICHEDDPQWTTLSTLAQHAIQYFGCRGAVADVMGSYYRLVVVSKHLPGHTTKIIDGYNLNPDVQPYEPVWDSILLYSLNALIDDSMEDEMETMAVDKQFGSWDMLAMYLQMHPANPEQAFTPRHRISWMMVIRMVRNVFCHEQFINWTMLKELDHIMMHYFATRDNVRAMLAVIHKHCFTSLLANERCPLTALDYSSFTYLDPPRIQYHESLNICMMRCCSSHLPRPVIGLTPVKALIDKMTRARHRGQHKVVLVTGDEQANVLAALAGYLNEIEREYEVLHDDLWTRPSNLPDSKSFNKITLVATSSANIIKHYASDEHKTKFARKNFLIKVIHGTNSAVFTDLCARDVERLARHIGGVPKAAIRAFRVQFTRIPLPAPTLIDVLMDPSTPLSLTMHAHLYRKLVAVNDNIARLKQTAQHHSLTTYMRGSLVLGRGMKHFTEQIGRCYYLQDSCWTWLLILDEVGGDALRQQWLNSLLLTTDKHDAVALLNDIFLCLPLYSCNKDRRTELVESAVKVLVHDTLFAPDTTVNHCAVLFDVCAPKLRSIETWASISAVKDFVTACLRTFKYRTLLHRVLDSCRAEF